MAKEKDPSDMTRDLLLQEVDEEVRAERLRQWWQRFGSWLVALAVALVMVTIGYEMWQSYHQKEGEQGTALLLEALRLEQEGKQTDALARLEQVDEASGDLAGLAKLRSANLLRHQGEQEKAEAFYGELTKEKNEALASYAKLQLGQYDAIKDSAPFYATAQELKARQLYSEGKKDEARKVVDALLEHPDMPLTQRQRLEELLQAYR